MTELKTFNDKDFAEQLIIIGGLMRQEFEAQVARGEAPSVEYLIDTWVKANSLKAKTHE